MVPDLFTGVLPAAGVGSRLRPLRCPKELLSIAFAPDPVTGVVQPMLAAEYSMRAMSDAGIRKCVMIISDRKSEMLRYFGNGTEAGLNIAYVNQPEPLGLASAVDAAFHWVAESNVCLALPDTVFSPRTALATIKEELIRTRADLVLGVFPTADPQQLGPVRMGRDGRVTEVMEKPAVTDIFNTWGIAAWTPRFTALLHARPAKLRKQSISQVFNEAVKRKLNVRAVFFESGSYTDLGTGASLAAMLFDSPTANAGG